MAQSPAIKSIVPPGIPKPIMPFSPAVRAGDWVFVAGQMATDFVNGLPPAIAEADLSRADKLAAEAVHLISTLDHTTAAAGASMTHDTVRVWQWFVSQDPRPEDVARGENWARIDVEPYRAVAGTAFSESLPATTDMGIRRLMITDTTVEVDLICRADGSPREPVGAPDDFAASFSGPYPAVRRGDYIFISGQTGVDDHSSRVDPSTPAIHTFERQLERALAKIAAIAQAAGGSIHRAIKAEVYLGDPRKVAVLDRVWRRWFPENPPARLVLPYMGLMTQGAQVEVALTVLADSSELSVLAVETSEAPEPLGPEPQAVVVGDLMWFSAQMPFDSRGALAAQVQAHPSFPFYTDTARAQMAYVLDNVSAIAEAGGTDLENIVRRAAFHDDFEHFLPTWFEWTSRFPGVPPASTTVDLRRSPLTVPGSRFILDLIAYVPSS